MGAAPCAPSPRVHVVMSRNEILAGDHLYTSRGIYDHHGIYIGENQVIHFQNSVQGTVLASSAHPFGPCSVCGYHSGMSGVVLTCLDCFLLGEQIQGPLYLPIANTFTGLTKESELLTVVGKEIVTSKLRGIVH